MRLYGRRNAEKTAFAFTIENRGGSVSSPDPADKADGLHAWVSVDRNPVYWPSEDGIVFRVRNEKRQYATEAKTFDNGAEGYTGIFKRTELLWNEMAVWEYR